MQTTLPSDELTVGPNAGSWDRWGERQGGTPVWDADSLKWLFPNGARGMMTGVAAEPAPTDPAKRRKRIKEFHTLRLSQTRADEQHLRLALAGQTDSPHQWNSRRYGPAPASGPDALKRLRELIAEDERRIAEITAEQRAAGDRIRPGC